MSTDKFHIGDAGRGNDAHSDFLMRMGYGDLLNRPGRQEMTIDTASMYKKASSNAKIIGTGIGAAAGGAVGSGLTRNMTATKRLLGTLAGVGVGGAAGYFVGSDLDTPGSDGLSWADKNTQLLNTIGLGAIGGLAGYGSSKYLLGSKNTAHNIISSLIGAGLGAGIGHSLVNEEEDLVNKAEANVIADKHKLTGSDRDRFVQFYSGAKQDLDSYNKNKSWYNYIIDPVYGKVSPEDAALAKVRGEKAKDREIKWGNILATAPAAGTAATHGTGAVLRRMNKNKDTVEARFRLLSDPKNWDTLDQRNANILNLFPIKSVDQMNDIDVSPGMVEVLDQIKNNGRNAKVKKQAETILDMLKNRPKNIKVLKALKRIFGLVR